MVIPLILITTSGRPTQRIRTICSDLHRVIPETVKTNRGKLNRDGVSEKAFELGADRMIIVERWKGGPRDIKLYSTPYMSEVPLTLYLSGSKTQDEFGRRITVSKNLIVTVERNALPHVEDLANLFAKFLCIPLFEEPLKCTDFKASAHFSSIGSDVKIAFTMPPIIREIGPLFTVKYVQGNAERDEDS